jgi:hypothetical protein
MEEAVLFTFSAIGLNKRYIFFNINMVGRHIFLGVISLAVIFLLVSCAPLIQKPGEEVVSTENVVDNTLESTTGGNEGSEVATSNSKPKITIVPPKEKPKPMYDPIVNDFITKAKEVGSYRYTFDASKGGMYDYYIYGQNARKVYLVPIKLKGDVNYNEVYFDTNLQNAVAVCTKGVSSCNFAWKKAYNVDYEKERVYLTPMSVVDNIPYSAKKVGEEVFDNQKTSIIEYVNGEGRKERLWMDHYTGLPLKQVIYSVDVENGDKELTKHTFTRVILNIKKSEVMFPEVDFEMQKW